MTLLDQPPRQILRGEGAKVAKFGETWIRQTKGRWAGDPLVVEPWQAEFLDELFLVYDDGERVYSEALLGIARKNGKSTISAVIALYLLLASGEQGPEVYAAAASADQARIVFGQACEFVRASPRLRDWLVPQRSAIICKANGGVFRVLASDAPLQYGLNPSGVVIDELWAHKNPELYYALTTGQGARENPLVVSITTAGFDRDSVCYHLYEKGRELLAAGGIDEMRRAGFLMKWFEAPAGTEAADEAGWRAANPSSWIRERDLGRSQERLPESVFRRLHLNQWTESEDAWILPHEWDACEAKVFGYDRPVFTAGEACWLMLDVGFRHDSSVLTWGQWHDDKLHVHQELLLPEDEGPTFGILDIQARLASRANVIKPQEVGYDPWQFQSSAETLAEQGVPMVEFPQNSARMAPASEILYELVTQRRLVHDGDRAMRNQILSAVAAPTDRGGWRISKRKSLERIDGAVSLAMLADRAVTLRNIKPEDRSVTFY